KFPSQESGDEKISEDPARDDAEAKRLATELEDMRQTLVRHQADFSNFRKRAEKENREAGQRATARVIEQLIPVVDGFEHAHAAELNASIPRANPSIRIFTRLSIARKPHSIQTARFSRSTNPAMSTTVAFFALPWFA